MTAIPQLDSFQRTANYWLKRAFRYLNAGQQRRAAVLFRHAARLEPTSLEARMGYAIALRALHCYEASNREAFAALAHDTTRYLPYHLIGLNMHSMGHKQEALDAMSFYLEGSFDGLFDTPSWDSHLYESEAVPFDPFEKLPAKQTRLEGLLRIAANQIKKGDLVKAKAALAQSSQKPYNAPNAQRSQLTALYYEKLGKPELTISHMNAAMRIAPDDAQIIATAAGLLWRLQNKRAYFTLLRAASLARTSLEELMVCTLADQMGQLHVAYRMLILAIKREPNRQPTCYNLSLCYLKKGQLKEALWYIHLCREIDTDDVQVEYLFALIEEYEAEAQSEAEIVEKAKGLSFYGMLSSHELKCAVAPLLQAFDAGLEEFAARLTKESKLYNRFLFALALPIEGAGSILPTLCELLPLEFSQRLLRHVLLIDPKDAAYKQTAIDLLAAMNLPSPYIIWHEGHIISVDPKPAPHLQPRLLQRLLYRQFRIAANMQGSSSIVPYMLEMVSRMSRAERIAVASDPQQIWPLAFAQSFNEFYHITPPIHYHEPQISNERAAVLNSAMDILRALSSQKEELK